MTTQSVQYLRRLIARLESLPLPMGGGDAEREALVTRLTASAEGGRELSLPDLWLAMRLLGPEGQCLVSEAFANIAACEAGAIEVAPCPVSRDDNAADDLIRTLAAIELPLSQARRRAALVRRFQAYLDNEVNDLSVRDLVDTAVLLGEEGFTRVETLLRSLFIGPLELACSTLWIEVSAHFGLNATLDQYLQGVQLVFPKRSGAKSARMKNLLPHITASADAAFCLRKNLEVSDIDDLTDRLASKLELIGETKLAAEIENALEVWSEFKEAFRKREGGDWAAGEPRGASIRDGLPGGSPSASSRGQGAVEDVTLM